MTASRLKTRCRHYSLKFGAAAIIATVCGSGCNGDEGGNGSEGDSQLGADGGGGFPGEIGGEVEALCPGEFMGDCDTMDVVQDRILRKWIEKELTSISPNATNWTYDPRKYMSMLTEIQVGRISSSLDDDHWGPITTFEGLQCFTALRRFDSGSYGGSAKDLCPFARSPYLVDLQVAKMPELRFSPLIMFLMLERLALEQVDISTVPDLRSLVRLRTMTLIRTTASNLRFLASCSALEDVGLLHNTSLTDIDGLGTLAKLRKVYISNSPVKSLVPLVDNQDFGAGGSLHFEKTSIKCETEAANIALLEGRGVTVTSDCVATAAGQGN